MSGPDVRIRLGAMFPGTNSNTVWDDPGCGSFTDFATYEHFARTAERAKLDFVFFAEGLRLREQDGVVYDRDLATRPDNFTLLSALAAVTERIGLAGTINSTFNEPFEVARQFATLDHLSDGRAGWNVVTTWDRFVGENFRRGGFLGEHERYERAGLFLDAALHLLAARQQEDVLADQVSGRFTRSGAGTFAHRDAQFDIRGVFPIPPGPQGRPIIFQAGSSEEGKEFAAKSADAIFGMYSSLPEKKKFYSDVKGRLAKYGRRPDSLLVLPASTFAIGDTEADARERARDVRLRQVDGQSAIVFLEELWNRDLSAYDPDGPLPDVDPMLDGSERASGLSSVRRYPDRLGTARRWRELAEADNLSIRQLAIEVMGHQTFVGTAGTIADQMITMVRESACDGFIMVPHNVPRPLDEFADQVVPILQDRGALRSDYEGSTLRDHLGLTTGGNLPIAAFD